MKKIIVIINLLLLLIFLSCTKKDNISITDKYELNLIDTLVISYQLRSPYVTINDDYIILFNSVVRSISIYDSTGNLIFNKNISGESPGKGNLICINGAFIKDEKLYIVFNIPPKISKYDLNGEFIEDIKYLYSIVGYSFNIDNEYISINHLSENGLEYVILDENNIENPISEFVVNSEINNRKYQEYFNKNPSDEGLGLLFYSVNNALFYIPDLYTGLIKIFNFNGDIIEKVKIVDDYYPPPFIDIELCNEIVNKPIPDRAIYPPIFLDSLIIVRVNDKYRNNWEKAKAKWNSFNDPDNEKYKDFLYIYNNNFELIDTVGFPIDDIQHVYSSNSLIYTTRQVDEEDSSYLIIYRYRLEEIDN